mgnify:CR=1 FL=1
MADEAAVPGLDGGGRDCQSRRRPGRGLPPVHLWDSGPRGEIDIVVTARRLPGGTKARLISPRGRWCGCSPRCCARTRTASAFGDAGGEDADHASEDAPFVAVGWIAGGDALVFTTNVGDDGGGRARRTRCGSRPAPAPASRGPICTCGAGWRRRVARPVFYELVGDGRRAGDAAGTRARASTSTTAAPGSRLGPAGAHVTGERLRPAPADLRTSWIARHLDPLEASSPPVGGAPVRSELRACERRRGLAGHAGRSAHAGGGAGGRAGRSGEADCRWCPGPGASDTAAAALRPRWRFRAARRDPGETRLGDGSCARPVKRSGWTQRVRPRWPACSVGLPAPSTGFHDHPGGGAWSTLAGRTIAAQSSGLRWPTSSETPFGFPDGPGQSSRSMSRQTPAWASGRTVLRLQSTWRTASSGGDGGMLRGSPTASELLLLDPERLAPVPC